MPVVKHSPFLKRGAVEIKVDYVLKNGFNLLDSEAVRVNTINQNKERSPQCLLCPEEVEAGLLHVHLKSNQHKLHTTAARFLSYKIFTNSWQNHDQGIIV